MGILRNAFGILRDILDKLSLENPNYPPETIIISGDGSILKNPGGQCSIGVVIYCPGNPWIELSKFTNGTTNNDAEFDAVYLGLLTLLASTSFPLYPIQIESDSKLVIESLNGKWKLKEPRLIRKRDMILELVNLIEAGVTFKWRKRNTTPALKRANDLAQTLNGVKNH